MSDEKAAEETVVADMGMNGDWVVESHDNLDAFLKKVGENWMKRKLADGAGMFKKKYTVMIKQTGNSFEIKAGKQDKMTLELGKTFETKIPPKEEMGKGKLTVSDDGKNLETTFEESTLKVVRTLDGEFLVEKKTFDGETLTIKMNKKAPAAEAEAPAAEAEAPAAEAEVPAAEPVPAA